ncbi:hypothetical protein QJS10_CPB20g00151 [Acorus calamus]|uniref:E3 ubiquitin-protein ligase synoviolin-like TPR repeats domain-containing protein n=1 Tax=Acorus calamus TaxID=4465 RepID=A0AAV9CBC5_ACOCL|nr:hypothetical protein QJS10_CPB20g00151 [Acorus calamus]
MRLQTYAALSLLTTAAAAAAIHYSFRISGQFFPAAVHLSTSNAFFLLLLLLFNNAAVAIHASAHLVQRIFLGKLREAEIESLNERSWIDLVEILCAITVFRPDSIFSFFGMEAALFKLKGLHWLAQKRFRYVKATPLEALHSQLRYMILAMNAVVILIKYVFFVADMLMEGAGSSNCASAQGPQAGETGVNLNRCQTILQAAALVHGKLFVTHAGSEAFTNVSHMNMDDVDTVERRRLSDARVTLSEHQEGLLKLSGACLNLRHQIEVEGRRFLGARASLLEAQESLLRLSEASLNLRKYIEVFKQALEFLEKLEVLKAIVHDIDS